ncbi:SPW repeat domain-containing protein [Roseimaritima sediminicola]|uniref:SPW repeat domain-containing protein n=1 Tax=Roseimaritima sediminicola TaxID=2662066 RepID=UPI001F458E33|nr:SPW repeat protein [Roseimaritima sediminicola]
MIEVMTAVWLALSPYIFGVQHQDHTVWFDSLTALAISVLAGLSYWRPTRHAHILTLLIATGLVLYGRFAESPPPPWHQNHIAVGLFLLMIAVIPNYASEPPLAYSQRLRRQTDSF